MKPTTFNTPALLLLSSLALALSGCASKEPGPEFAGAWLVDIDKTLQRSTAEGLPASAVPQVREAFVGGRLDISNDAIVLSVEGYPGNETWKYTATATGKGCYNLAIEGKQQTLGYCVSGDELAVKQPGFKGTVVYTRR